MREKGLCYKVNWGISQMDLRTIAEPYGKDKQLAIGLWAEHSRECKILATLIMPAEEMSCSEAVEWARKFETVEIAEIAAFNLFQYIAEADALATCLFNSGDKIERLCAYNITCRLVKRHNELSENLSRSMLEAAAEDLKSANRQLLHQTVNCLDTVVGNDAQYADRAAELLKDAGIDSF